MFSVVRSEVRWNDSRIEVQSQCVSDDTCNGRAENSISSTQVPGIYEVAFHGLESRHCFLPFRMPAQETPQRSSMRRSLDLPMSAFNKRLIEEVGKLSASKDHVSRAYSTGSRGRRVVCLTRPFRPGNRVLKTDADLQC